MRRLGLPANDKTSPTASTRVDFLGVTIDSVRQDFTVSEPSRQYALMLFERTARRRRVSRTDLQSLGGTLVWLSFVVRGGQVHTQSVFSLLRRTKHHRLVPVPGSVRRDLAWWRLRLRDGNWVGSRFWLRRDDIAEIPLYTDASGDRGFGGSVLGWRFAGAWPEHLLDRSIAWKELLPVALVCYLFGPLLRSSILRTCVDNTSVAFMINAMRSRDDDCMALLRLISRSSSRYAFDLLSDWVSRELNVLADYLSKLHDAQVPVTLMPVRPQEKCLVPLILHHVATGSVYSCRVLLPYGLGQAPRRQATAAAAMAAAPSVTASWRATPFPTRARSSATSATVPGASMTTSTPLPTKYD